MDENFTTGEFLTALNRGNLNFKEVAQNLIEPRLLKGCGVMKTKSLHWRNGTRLVNFVPIEVELPNIAYREFQFSDPVRELFADDLAEALAQKLDDHFLSSVFSPVKPIMAEIVVQGAAFSVQGLTQALPRSGKPRTAFHPDHISVLNPLPGIEWVGVKGIEGWNVRVVEGLNGRIPYFVRFHADITKSDKLRVVATVDFDITDLKFGDVHFVTNVSSSQ